MVLRLFVLLFLVSFSVPSFAQTVSGTAVVDGKKVILYDDFSWDFQSEKSKNCKAVGRGISFCGNSSKWKLTDPGVDDIAAMYRLTDSFYALIIIEELGFDDGFSLEFMRSAVIENAASAAGVASEQVTILDVNDSITDDYSETKIDYAVNVDGLDIAYQNTIRIADEKTFQIITYALDTEITEKSKSRHIQFLDAMKIDW